MVPGVAAYLLAIAAVLLTALTIAAEWERGSMEQLFASPVGRLEIVLGKLLPYLALGMLQLLLVITLGTTVFDVPIRGSLPVIFLAGLFFLAAMLGQGLFISVIARNQLVATQAGALLSDAFGFAHRLGIKTCVGTESPLDLPDVVKARLQKLGMKPSASSSRMVSCTAAAAAAPNCAIAPSSVADSSSRKRFSNSR